MRLAFSRKVDPDEFVTTFTFDQTDFDLAFDGQADPNDVFFQMFGPNLRHMDLESVARLAADFAALVTAALAKQAKTLNITGSEEPGGTPA